jgi:hypothetical protein
LADGLDARFADFRNHSLMIGLWSDADHLYSVAKSLYSVKS